MHFNIQFLLTNSKILSLVLYLADLHYVLQLFHYSHRSLLYTVMWGDKGKPVQMREETRAAYFLTDVLHDV